MLLDRRRSQLVIIDVQERLAPAVRNSETVVANVIRLLRYAHRLGIPVTATEQNPSGIGRTVPEVAALIKSADGVTFPKMAFSAWREPDIKTRIESLVGAGRDQVVVAGMESHVCVLQFVVDMHACGHEVSVVSDAMGSRADVNYVRAVERLRRGNVQVVTQEMVAFEWLERADTPEFKDILQLLR